jgi:hypothetical protein
MSHLFRVSLPTRRIRFSTKSDLLASLIRFALSYQPYNWAFVSRHHPAPQPQP